jgi:hypothetical protein
MFVYLKSKTAYSFSYRKSLSEQAPRKGFEQGGHSFGFPDFFKDGVGVG